MLLLSGSFCCRLILGSGGWGLGLLSSLCRWLCSSRLRAGLPLLHLWSAETDLVLRVLQLADETPVQLTLADAEVVDNRQRLQITRVCLLANCVLAQRE